MNQIKFPLLACILLCSTFSYSQVKISGESQKWHTTTLTFEGPNTSESSSTNPFLDYRLDVTFKSPSGNTFIIPGFYAADGNAGETGAKSGNKWRVRFTPNELGNWSYTASFRTGSDIAVSKSLTAGSTTSFHGSSGNFNIAPNTKNAPDNRSKGRLNYVGERYLRFEETGEYFLKAGSDSPENLLAYNDFDNTVASKTWGPHARDWKNGDPTWRGDKGKELIGAINYLSSKGMNAFSFLTMSVKGDGKDVWPWVASSNGSLDGDSGSDAKNRLRYDVSKLAQWEVLFSHADTKGMYLHFKTQETENDQLLDGGDLGIQRKLYYRELIARFGHHLALNWNLGEENDLYHGQNNSNKQRRGLGDTQNKRVKSYASYIASIDAYSHHIVIHSFPETNAQESLYRPLLGNNSLLTGASTQLQINTIHDNVKKWISESKSSGKNWVVTNDEQGDHKTGVTADKSFNGDKGIQADNRRDTRHKVLWGTLMAGGAGVEYYFGYQTGETDLTAQDFRSRDSKWNDAKIALDFFNDHLPFWKMETNDGLTSNTGDFCFAKLNQTYAIYLPNGGSTNLDLSNANGSFTIKWFNPKNGGNLLNGSVEQIDGGAMRSVGNPPDSTSSDWVVLVQADEAGKRPVNDNCSLNLGALSDFPNIEISEFSPAYKDENRSALAINAVKYKGRFAAAQTVFNGKSGLYLLTLNTLTEVDGESTYRIAINGNRIGTYTNPSTTVDYGLAGTSFKDIALSKGDIIRVEFNSHTNGNIPEGNSTAYSRGRWISLDLECQTDSITPPIPSDDCEADAEEIGGVVVIEAESLQGASGWVKATSKVGFTGSGYIDWQGANSFPAPGNGVISGKIKINKPGTYRFQWRSKVGEGTNSTESNDSWLRFPDADDFFAQKGNAKIYPTGSGKTPNPEGASANGWFKVYLSGTTKWTWSSKTSDNNAHDIYVKFDSPGTYTMEISGRSKHHLIDRITLSNGSSKATDLAHIETLCQGGDTAPIRVSSVDVSPKTDAVEAGASLTLDAQVLPKNAADQIVIWSSSDPDVATVSQNGQVKGLKEGTVDIIVTTNDGNFTNLAEITVMKKTDVLVAVSGIKVSPQQATLKVGETTALDFAMRPSNASNLNVIWRSGNPEVATVDQNGRVTALKKGTVEIEAVSEDGAYRSDATVKILAGANDPVSVTGITLSKSTVSIVEANSIILNYVISPVNATDKDILWSSENDAIATVNQEGVVSAVKIGETSIFGITKDGGFKATVLVKVTKKPNLNVPARGVYVTPQRLTLAAGETDALTYEMRPFNASNDKVIWSSGNTTIATVDENGTVTALKPGSVEIQAMTEDGGYRSDASVTVVLGDDSAIGATGISIVSSSTNVVVGSRLVLDSRLLPLNATNNKVVWSSSNTNVVTVDQNGEVLGLKEGVALISVVSEDGGFVDRVTVNVVSKPQNRIAVRNVYVTPQFLNLKSGETAVVTYRILPTNATNKNVIWSSGDESIATVDQNGRVVALSSGTVEIEATTVDGSLKSDATLKVVSNSDSAKGSLIAYPNPTHDEVRISGTSGDSAWIGIYTFNGVLLKRRQMTKGQDATISLAEYPAGYYVVKVLDLNSTSTQTIIKR